MSTHENHMVQTASAARHSGKRRPARTTVPKAVPAVTGQRDNSRLMEKVALSQYLKNIRPKENNDLRPVALTYSMYRYSKTYSHWCLIPTISKPICLPGVDDALLVMLNNIYDDLAQANRLVKIVFIDFSSAYNTIQLHLLIKWINRFLVNRTQQSVMSFGLICMFGNMRAQDKVKLQRLIKAGGRIIGIDQESATSLYTNLILQKLESILQDNTHFLHSKLCHNSSWTRGMRLLQKKIRMDIYGNSFIPTAIRLGGGDWEGATRLSNLLGHDSDRAMERARERESEAKSFLHHPSIPSPPDLSSSIPSSPDLSSSIPSSPDLSSSSSSSSPSSPDLSSSISSSPDLSFSISSSPDLSSSIPSSPDLSSSISSSPDLSSSISSSLDLSCSSPSSPDLSSSIPSSPDLSSSISSSPDLSPSISSSPDLSSSIPSSPDLSSSIPFSPDRAGLPLFWPSTHVKTPKTPAQIPIMSQSSAAHTLSSDIPLSSWPPTADRPTENWSFLHPDE
ncbi:unnamed protein product, partial [Coregonus sp. 'balchen']